MPEKGIVLLIVLLCSFGLSAQETVIENTDNQPGIEKEQVVFASDVVKENLSEPQYLYGSKFRDIFTADFMGFGLTFAATGLNFGVGALLGIDGEVTIQDQILSSSVTNLASIPLYFSGSPDVLPMTGITLLLTGAEYLAASEYGLYSREHQWFYWAGNNLAMYNAYDAYASYRIRSPAWDNSSFKRYSSFELLKSPFMPAHFKEPVFWAAVGASAVTAASVYLLERSDAIKTEVWNTGEWYLGEKKMTPQGFWLNFAPYVFTANTIGAIGEEGVYRGFMHEELSCRFGRTWATVIDTSAFLAMHVATDIARGEDWKYIVLHGADVSLANIIFDYAYDKGGLPLAIASHAWTNFTVNFILAFLTFGVPQSWGTN